MESFKKGALVLAPVGTIVLDDDEGKIIMRNCRGTLHAAMVDSVKVKVMAGRRSKAVADSKTTPYIVRSPLLAAKLMKDRSVCDKNVAPFWALLECAGPRAPHNMEQDTEVFRDAGFEIKGGQYPKFPHGVQFHIELPIVRNVRHISKGEVLCLPFGHE
jgi:hypothetical protein